MTYEKYMKIYLMCLDETQRYNMKELYHHRGWITTNEINKILPKLNIQQNKENAARLHQRMLSMNPSPEKIENDDPAQV